MSRPWEKALDEQLHLIRWLETSVGAGYTKTVSPSEGLTTPEALRSALNRAETFWVSFDLYRLIRHAADKLKGRTLRECVPPARADDGFVLLDRPAGLSQEENEAYFAASRALTDEEERKVEAEKLRRIYQAFSWHVMPQGVQIRPYAFTQITDGGRRGWSVVFPSAGSDFPAHLAPTGETGNFHIDTAYDDIPLYRFLVAFWLLCDQRLVRSSPTPVDRHSRRRAERANLDLADGIKVITLRREDPRPATAAADRTEVNWSHRWIVSEHTRNQWYPSLGMHLPITIDAYEKGPEGAPLVIKDTIYKVDR